MLENIIVVERNFTHHSTASLKFHITTNLNRDATMESWGFNEFMMSIDRCHPTCKDCVGPLKN